MATVLVTRPHADALRTAATLQALGHEPIVSPVLGMCTLPVTLARRPWQAVLFTSRNAAQRMPDAFVQPELPCLTVGASTAKAVRARGFETVLSADGDVNTLFDMAMARLRTAAGPVLYPCGVHRTGQLAERLRECGYDVVLAPCYETKHRPLTSEAMEAMAGGRVDAALLYSPRSADAFAAAVENTSVKPLDILVLSQAVAQALPPYLRTWARWPDVPLEAALLDLLRTTRHKD